MKYEIYLRFGNPPKPLPLSQVLASLKKSGFGVEDGLPSELALDRERLTVALSKAPDSDNAPDQAAKRETATSEDSKEETGTGLDFAFPMGLTDENGDRAIMAILAVASELGGVLFDPQIGGQVGASDHNRIADSWRRSYEFHFGIIGSPDLGSGAPMSTQDEEGFPSHLKLILVAGAIILFLIMLGRSCAARWTEQNLYPPAPTAPMPQDVEQP